MALNKGYLTAKTDKASDEVYTPACAETSYFKFYSIYYLIDFFFILYYNKYIKEGKEN